MEWNRYNLFSIIKFIKFAYQIIFIKQILEYTALGSRKYSTDINEWIVEPEPLWNFTLVWEILCTEIFAMGSEFC